MTVVDFSYELRKRDIKTLYPALGKIIAVKRSVSSLYPEVEVSCAYIPEVDRFPIRMWIKGEEGRVYLAFKECVGILGLPNFVESGSDYRLVERVLQMHGKTLRRRNHGGFVGKHVVAKAENLECVLAR